jgi:hypothetical protein
VNVIGCPDRDESRGHHDDDRDVMIKVAMMVVMRHHPQIFSPD